MSVGFTTTGPPPSNSALLPSKSSYGADGWVETRQQGSHVRLERGGEKITIADHGGKVIIPRGTLSATLKQAGMTAEELRRLL